MVYLEIAGRAGNQLFRYFAAKNVLKNHSEEFYIGFRHVYKHGWENDLKKFGIDDYKEDPDGNILKKNTTFIQKILIFIYKSYVKINEKNKYKIDKFQRKTAKLYNKFGIYISDLSYIDFKFNNNVKTKVFLGCFESPMYLKNVDKNFIMKKKCNENNKELYKKIKESNSICITIRRGDFLQYTDHNICDKLFYFNAIKLIKDNVSNPVFFIFSDDIEWCKENIKDENYEFYYESGNDSIDEKLRLMSSCKHFIVSNSTFSWWAQYLGTYNKKIVIGPSKMYKYNIDSELILDDWIKL